jgi:hypothetical protein
MIEATVLNYLIGQNIVGNNVYLEVPVNPPAEYIILEKTASGKTNQINQAMFAIQSYSKNSLLRAAEINEAVKAALDVMPYTENIFSCNLNSDYNYTDTETKEYCYQAVYNLTF